MESLTGVATVNKGLGFQPPKISTSTGAQCGFLLVLCMYGMQKYEGKHFIAKKKFNIILKFAILFVKYAPHKNTIHFREPETVSAFYSC